MADGCPLRRRIKNQGVAEKTAELGDDAASGRGGGRVPVAVGVPFDVCGREVVHTGENKPQDVCRLLGHVSTPRCLPHAQFSSHQLWLR